MTCYSRYTHDPIATIFDRSVTEKVRNIIRCFVFPPHLSSASALPCEIGNPEDSALVHCACNTVQLLQRSRLCLNHAPNSPELNALITRYRELYSSVSMSRESKILKKSSSWLSSGNALIQRLSEKCYFCVLVWPGSADAQVICGGIVNRLDC